MKPLPESEQALPDTLTNKTSIPFHRTEITSRWTAILGAIVIGLLYLALPEHLTFGPSWLLLAIEIPLLLPLIFTLIIHRPMTHVTTRFLTLAVLGAVTLGIAASIALLITTLSKNTQGGVLLRSAALLWCSNILVFALWYWEVDGGGPRKRHEKGHEAADFMFPQQVNGNTDHWIPHFIDYLFVAFTGATALSPADTYPLTRPAKLLMMAEAILSLIIIVLLAGRAVNILG